MRRLSPKFLCAMIAVRALPGSPKYDGDDALIVKQALDDLRHYAEVKVDAVFLENDHDIPFIKPPLPQRALEVMERVAQEVRQRFSGPLGIQLLEGANESALEIAARADYDFVRVESYVYAHVGSAGIIEGCAGQLLRRRKELDCEHIKVWADVKKKHCSHSITADLDITDEVRQAELYLVDGVVVTGARTGVPPNPEELARVKACTQLPVVIGSGMTPENLEIYRQADGFIVGSAFRKDGKFLEELDRARLDRFMRSFSALKEKYTTDSHG